LPNEILDNIIGNLGEIDAICLGLTAHRFNELVLRKVGRSRLSVGSQQYRAPAVYAELQFRESFSCRAREKQPEPMLVGERFLGIGPWFYRSRLRSRTPSYTAHDKLMKRLWTWFPPTYIYCDAEHRYIPMDRITDPQHLYWDGEDLKGSCKVPEEQFCSCWSTFTRRVQSHRGSRLEQYAYRLTARIRKAEKRHKRCEERTLRALLVKTGKARRLQNQHRPGQAYPSAKRLQRKFNATYRDLKMATSQQHTESLESQQRHLLALERKESQEWRPSAYLPRCATCAIRHLGDTLYCTTCTERAYELTREVTDQVARIKMWNSQAIYRNSTSHLTRVEMEGSISLSVGYHFRGYERIQTGPNRPRLPTFE
jgi:hypothetical protein